MQTIPKITVNKDDKIGFAQMLRNAQAFNTHGNLRARRSFSGFGDYRPFDEVEVDEMMAALYVVYSYDTPIAWLTREGVWVKNFSTYSATTSKHQNKVFSAIDLLR
jgi:hypothetical protein